MSMLLTSVAEPHGTARYRFILLALVALASTSAPATGCGDGGQSDAGNIYAPKDGIDPTERDTATPELSESLGASWDGSYPQGCRGVASRELFACIDQMFWQCLKYQPEQRRPVLLAIAARTAELEEDASPDISAKDLASIYWRSAQLSVALWTENRDSTGVGTMKANLERAHEILPDSTEIEGWLRTIALVQAVMTKAPERDEAEQALWDVYERNPTYVLPTMIAATFTLPLRSGFPDKAAAAAEELDCRRGNWCDKDTPRAKHTRSGIELNFGEVFARIGDRERALEHFRAALEVPGADTWPYRYLAEDWIANVDERMQAILDRGPNANVATLTESNGAATCVMCHTE
jgi:hypothetical protein